MIWIAEQHKKMSYILFLCCSGLCMLSEQLILPNSTNSHLARWFWPDLMNGKHDHTTAVTQPYGMVWYGMDNHRQWGQVFNQLLIIRA